MDVHQYRRHIESMLEAERAEVLPCLQESSERGSLTVRGRTGAVKLLEPVRTEKCEDIIHALEKSFCDAAFQQIRHMAPDQPSPKLQQWPSVKMCKLDLPASGPTTFSHCL